MWLIDLILFVALRWTFSIEILSFFKYGDQITEAYSKWGLTKVLYKVLNISISMYVWVLNIIPSVLFALFTDVWMCTPNFKSLSKVTPKSFSFSAGISCMSWSNWSFKTNLLCCSDLPMCMCLHFWVFKVMSHFLSILRQYLGRFVMVFHYFVLSTVWCHLQKA